MENHNSVLDVAFLRDPSVLENGEISEIPQKTKAPLKHNTSFLNHLLKKLRISKEKERKVAPNNKCPICSNSKADKDKKNLPLRNLTPSTPLSPIKWDKSTIVPKKLFDGDDGSEADEKEMWMEGEVMLPDLGL